jgi:hypothetical protein
VLELPPLVDDAGFSLAFERRSPEDVADAVLAYGAPSTDEPEFLAYLRSDPEAPLAFDAWRRRNLRRLPADQTVVVAGLSLELFIRRCELRHHERARFGFGGYFATKEEFEAFLRREITRQLNRFTVLTTEPERDDAAETAAIREIAGMSDVAVESYTDDRGGRPRPIVEDAQVRLGAQGFARAECAALLGPGKKSREAVIKRAELASAIEKEKARGTLQKTIAEAIGCSETTLSRFLTQHRKSLAA